MMKTFIALITLVIGSIGIAVAEQQTITLDVKKMTCALCPLTVRTAIEKVDGVVSVEVDFSEKTAKVTFDDSVTNTDTVAEASTNAGYPATPQ